MKKTLLVVSMLALGTVGSFAQSKKINKNSAPQNASLSVVQATPNAAAATAEDVTIQFKSTTIDLGNIPQNIPAEAEFVFTNTGKEALVISNVKAACGCTTPYYTTDAIAKGKTGVVKASYNAASPGPFNKSITVSSNGGTVTLFIKGNVEKAPESSVPQNASMMKK